MVTTNGTIWTGGNVTVTYPNHQPAVCPDCGRCRTCGQPQPPITVQPTWGTYDWPQPFFSGSSISLTAADAIAGEVR